MIMSCMLVVKVRKWEQGCYTVVHDTDTEGWSLPLTLSDIEGLELAHDLVLYVGCQGEKVGAGMLHISSYTDTKGLQFALDLVLYVGCQGEEVGAGMLHISSWYWHRGARACP